MKTIDKLIMQMKENGNVRTLSDNELDKVNGGLSYGASPEEVAQEAKENGLEVTLCPNPTCQNKGIPTLLHLSRTYRVCPCCLYQEGYLDINVNGDFSAAFQV